MLFFADMISFILQCFVEVKYGDMFPVLCLCASAVYKAQVLEGDLLLSYLFIIGLWHVCAFDASFDVACDRGSCYFFMFCFHSFSGKAPWLRSCLVTHSRT